MRVFQHLTPITLSLLIFSSCGLIWNKEKKDLAEKLFKEYPIKEGDVPYEPVFSTHPGKEVGHPVTDTLLIVQNGDKYFEIDKEGNRTEVVYYRVRR